MSDAPAYDRAVADNITAARARRRLSQKSVAARMQALGFGWRQQIVTAAETGGRRVSVAELLGLALALETSTGALLSPSLDEKLIELPSGDVLLSRTVIRSAQHFNDGMVAWDGDVPRFATHAPETWPDTQIGRDLRETIREFGASSPDMIERDKRLHPRSGPYPTDYPPLPDLGPLPDLKPSGSESE
jgi:hypothetical protein